MATIWLHNVTDVELVVEVRSHLGGARYRVPPKDSVEHADAFVGINYLLVWVPDRPGVGNCLPVGCFAIVAEHSHLYEIDPDVAKPVTDARFGLGIGC